jgi:hypothetical protein
MMRRSGLAERYVGLPITLPPDLAFQSGFVTVGSALLSRENIVSVKFNSNVVGC